MEASEIGWSTLSAGIIVRLTEILRQTNRWGWDGPALRQVNKYWCAQLSQHIVEVFPHKRRDLVEKDAQSLLKFRQVRSLDLISFFRSNKYVNPWGSSSETVRALAQMPKLSNLRINWVVFGMLDDLDLKQLEGITSVHVTECGGRMSRSEMLKLSHLPLQKVHIENRVYYLSEFLAAMPSLKQLEVRIPEPKSSADLLGLNALDEVILHVDGSVNPCISEITSIVSLDISCRGMNTVEPLVSLPKLRHLKLTVDGTDVLEIKFLKLVMQGLLSLELENVVEHPAIIRPLDLPVDFGIEARRLVELSVVNFGLGKTTNLEHLLQRLTCLTLIDCKDFQSWMSFVSSNVRISLTTMAYNWVYQAAFGADVFGVSLNPYHRLKTLELVFTNVCQMSSQILTSISKLPHLEFLKLRNGLTCYEKNFPYESFEQVVDMPLLSELFLSGKSVWPATLQGILHMPSLTRLEKLTIQAPRPIPYLSFVERSVDALKQRAPRLKLDISFIN